MIFLSYVTYLVEEYICYTVFSRAIEDVLKNCVIGVLIVIGKLFGKITLDRCCPNELIQISGHSVVGCDERGISRGVELRPSGPTEDLLDIILRSTFLRIARCRRRFLRLRLRGASPAPGSNPRNFSAS